MRLKNLLLILAIVSGIRCAGQTCCNKGICLSFAEFDFYATALVERDTYKRTDSLCNAKSEQQNEKITELSGIIRIKDAEVVILNGEVARQKEIVSTTESRLTTSDFWRKFWRKTAFIGAAVVVIEAGAIALLIR